MTTAGGAELRLRRARGHALSGGLPCAPVRGLASRRAVARVTAQASEGVITQGVRTLPPGLPLLHPTTLGLARGATGREGHLFAAPFGRCPGPTPRSSCGCAELSRALLAVCVAAGA